MFEAKNCKNFSSVTLEVFDGRYCIIRLCTTPNCVDRDNC